MSYHVFIEGAQNPAAVADVAAAIARRYGLPADALEQRFAAGRFRVKANVDLDTARAFAGDLTRLGAIAAIVDAATGLPAPAATPTAPAAAPTVATPAAAASPAAAAASARRPPAIPVAPTVRAPAGGRSAAEPPVPPPPEPLQSGLAAAYSGRHEAHDLGVLTSALESGELRLATLDGSDDVADEAPPAESFSPPGGEPRAEGAPAGGDLDAAGAFSPPAEAFGPPPEEAPLDIDPAALVRTTPPPMAAVAAPELEYPDPAPGAPATAPAPGAPAVAPATASPPAAVAVPWHERALAAVRAQFLDRPQVRFAAGIVLAVVLAWIPARLYWGAKVDAEQKALTASLREVVAAARTDEAAWQAYTEAATAQKGLAESRMVNHTVTALLVWLALGGLIGFVYFKKIPWDEL
ncbi:MAG: hypothetical protein D6689_21275 [Deltaproteobacteria bacterium]|nr:MAG: hypothetical protein D6689_21275 [Deltaproteobacteria bacterium]